MRYLRCAVIALPAPLNLLFRENFRIESFGKPGSTPAERKREQANHQKSTHPQRRRHAGQCVYMQAAPPQPAAAASSASPVADARVRALPHELLHLQHKQTTHSSSTCCTFGKLREANLECSTVHRALPSLSVQWSSISNAPRRAPPCFLAWSLLFTDLLPASPGGASPLHVTTVIHRSAGVGASQSQPRG
jgi:hypothetical protein